MRFLHALLVMSLLAVPAFAEPMYITFPSDVDWVTRESEHFQILYRRGEDATARRTLNAAERAHTLLAPVFGETPPRTWIVLADFHDSLNGYAIDYPMPHFVVFLSPPEPSSQLASLDSWLESVVLHEYTHVLHLYPAHSFWAWGRAIFGSWVLPNGLMPSHLHEGLATFLETQFTTAGRGRSASFSMYTRMAVKEGAWGKDFVPLDLLEGSNTRWPQGAAPYYFGYYLFEELWQRKQAAGIGAFVQKTSRAIPYLINRPISAVYGEEYPSLWKTIFEKNGQIAQAEIEKKQKTPLSSSTYLTQDRFHKWDLTISPEGDRLAWRQAHPDTGSTLQILDLQGEKKLDSVEMESGRQEGMCWLRAGEESLLAYAETDSGDGYSKNVLRLYNPRTHKEHTPKSEGRAITHVQSIGCSPDGWRLLTYQEQATHGTVRLWTSEDGQQWKTREEWKVETGDWVTSLFFPGPAMAVRRGNNTLVFSLALRKAELLTTLPGHFHHFSGRPVAGEILAVGAPEGVEEVWALNLGKRTARRVVSVLGGVNSFAQDTDRWWVLDYRHGGYDVAQVQPITASAKPLPPPLPAPAPVAETKISDEQDYSPGSTILPSGWIPSMLIVPNGMQFSAWVPGFDVSQKHIYNLFGGYDTRGSPFFTADYNYRFGRSRLFGLGFDYFPAYLISDRKFLHQWGANISIGGKIAKDWPRVTFSAIFKRVEPVWTYPRLTSVGVSLGISHTFWTKTAPRAIAPLRSTSVNAGYARYFKELGSTDQYYAFTAGIDQYLGLWGRHAIKLSAHMGLTEGTTLHNSFYQGGGELIFSQGRGYFLNRGFAPGTFAARKLFMFNLDYLFPIVQVERGIQQWPFFLKRIDGAIVADVGTEDRRAPFFARFYYSAGIELKSHWKVFYYFPAQVRLGAYHGFGPLGETVYVTSAFEASL